MTIKLPAALLSAAMLAAHPAQAQQGGKQPELTPEQQAEMAAWEKAGTPGAEHKRLAATTGTYDMKIKTWHEPGAPPIEDSGTATRTMDLDGRVLVEQVTATMMGTPFAGRGMTGFDNVTGEYWSTWVDNGSTALFVSHGTCDAKEVCTFTGAMTDAVTKKPKTTRMISRKSSPTVEVFEMHGPDKSGKEMKMMEIVYTKKP